MLTTLSRHPHAHKVIEEAVVRMEKSAVAIVKGERGHEPVFNALNLIEFKSCLTGYSKSWEE
jgi:hypothetical protein